MSQQTQTAAGQRITFTSQQLPNGINIAGGVSHAGSTIISTSQLPTTTTIKTITQSNNNALPGAGQHQLHHGLPQQVQVHHQVLQAATGQGAPNQGGQNLSQQQSVGATQTQTLVIKSNHAVSLPTAAGLVSNAPGIVTMTKTINQGNQPLLNSMIPASVVVGMRPPNAGQQQQKTVQNNTLGRVVIGGPHMVNTRPQSPAITLSTLTPGQTPALILKTENGFQLLRVGTATSAPVTQTIGTNSTNPTQIRLQTVPAAVSRFTGPPIALRKTIVRSSNSTTTTTTTTQHQPQQQLKHPLQALATKQIKQNKSLPLLRQALYAKELIIEGIKPPPQHVVGIASLQQQLPKIQAQIRPISQNQTTTIGQTQVRMITPAAAPPRPIGHTTIMKQPGGLRMPTSVNGPRLVNAQIRGPIPATIQQQTPPQLQTAPPPTVVQMRTPAPTHNSRPSPVQIRATKGGKNSTAAITHVKVGQTQIKAISSTTSSLVATTNQPPSLAAISNSVPSVSLSSSGNMLSTINMVASGSASSGGTPTLPTPSLPTVQLPPGVYMNSNSSSIDAKVDSKTMPISASLTEIKSDKLAPTSLNALSIAASKSSGKSTTASTSKSSAKRKKDQMDKEKEDKSAHSAGTSASTASLSSFYQQPSISMSSSLYGDDDINDVAAMGGVNLAEESQRILGCTENIGTQIRSCKDEVFLNLPALQARIRAKVMEQGFDDPSQDVAVLISHACQERLKNIVEKLAVIAEHRIDVIKLDPRYEITKDVRAQIKFLEELDKAEQKRHEEMEREILLRAAKSRSKIEDPEQAKMKARAKEMQRAEMEELRQRDANMTALQAIGPRKKLKLESDANGTGTSTGANGTLSGTSNAPAPLRPRIKRVNLRDMIFFMESERETCRSGTLYKAYLK